MASHNIRKHDVLTTRSDALEIQAHFRWSTPSTEKMKSQAQAESSGSERIAVSMTRCPYSRERPFRH